MTIHITNYAGIGFVCFMLALLLVCGAIGWYVEAKEERRKRQLRVIHNILPMPEEPSGAADLELSVWYPLRKTH